jgi:hypothetical protein
MVAYCNNCKRYVNQYCDRCGDNFGITICEKYACGGSMKCPYCGGTALSAKKEFGPDPYDYRAKAKDQTVHEKREERPRVVQAPQAAPSAAGSTCPLCGYKILQEWKYCPMCGVSFQMRK